jgi:hypothetical protein
VWVHTGVSKLTAESIAVRSTCARCAADARVSVLTGYPGGRPQRVWFCLRCADGAYDEFVGVANPSRRRRLGVGSLLLAAGVLLMVVSLLADTLGINGSPGFGWFQQSAVILGGVLLLLGAVSRADIVAVIGTLLLLAGLLADVAGRMGSPGFGWRQALALVVGFALFVSGWLIRAHAHRGEAR